MRHRFFVVLLITIVLLGLVSVCAVKVGRSQVGTEVGGVIDQDTTWTPSGSPYTLASDTLVNQNVTLTIQSGVTVNLGNYSLEVNGSFVAIGTNANPVRFNSGAITATSTSNGYNKQTGLGSNLENGVINGTTITCDNTTKINQCNITGTIEGDFGIVSSSTITGDVNADVVSASTINGSVSAKTLLNNNIVGNVIPFASAQNNNITGSVDLVGNCIVSNNFIQGNITISSGTSTISSNTITSPTTAIDINPSADLNYVETTIKSNQIEGAQIGINMETDVNPAILGWTSRATILLNSITGGSYAGILVNSQQDPATNPYGNKATIMENVISNNNYGIQANPNSTIQGNLIINNQIGVYGGIITENTIINNTIGVVGTDCNYNNIQNSGQYNLALGQFGDISVTGNVDATNNWWGTNDVSAINQTIFDSKDNSSLGNVTYVPFLTAQNSAAPPQDYNVTAGATLTPLTTPSPSPTISTATSTYPTVSQTPTPINTQTSPLATWVIIIVFVTIAVLAILFFRRRRR